MALIQTFSFAAYFVMELPSSFIINKVGYKNGLSLGLLIMSLGSLGIYITSLSTSYLGILGSLFIIFSGMTLLQVSANPLASFLGPKKTASQRINIAATLNSLATTLGPAIIGQFILTKEDTSLDHVAWVYVFMTALLLGCSWIIFKYVEKISLNTQKFSFNDLFKKSLATGIIAIFLYVGAEVSIGSFLIILFIQQFELTESQALWVVPAYWGSMLIGRFVSIYLLKNGNNKSVFMIYTSLIICLGLIAILSQNTVATYGLVLIGLFNSALWAIIFSNSIKDTGDSTNIASALLVMAISGGAVIPWIQGRLGDSIGILNSFLVPIICYALLWGYGLVELKRSSSCK